MARTVKEVVAGLAAAYPQRPVEPQTLSVYVRALSDLDADLLESVARQHIATQQWFPTVAEIRRAYFDSELGLASPLEAWADVTRTIRVGGGLPELRASNPLAALVAGQIGWEAIRLSPRPDIIRSQFVKAYEAARAVEVDDANMESLGTGPRAVIESRQARALTAAAEAEQ